MVHQQGQISKAHQCKVFKDRHLSDCSETRFILALCGPE